MGETSLHRDTADELWRLGSRDCRGRGRTHVFEAAHEVVADRGAGQVGRVLTPTDVEEVVGAQHGVVLLGVARGGQDAVHQDGDLQAAILEILVFRVWSVRGKLPPSVLYSLPQSTVKCNLNNIMYPQIHCEHLIIYI